MCLQARVGLQSSLNALHLCSNLRIHDDGSPLRACIFSSHVFGHGVFQVPQNDLLCMIYPQINVNVTFASRLLSPVFKTLTLLDRHHRHCKADKPGNSSVQRNNSKQASLNHPPLSSNMGIRFFSKFG